MCHVTRCQKGELEAEVKANFEAAIKYLEEQKVSGITGDCGFMLWFQVYESSVIVHYIEIRNRFHVHLYYLSSLFAIHRALKSRNMRNR